MRSETYHSQTWRLWTLRNPSMSIYITYASSSSIWFYSEMRKTWWGFITSRMNRLLILHITDNTSIRENLWNIIMLVRNEQICSDHNPAKLVINSNILIITIRFHSISRALDFINFRFISVLIIIPKEETCHTCTFIEASMVYKLCC